MKEALTGAAGEALVLHSYTAACGTPGTRLLPGERVEFLFLSRSKPKPVWRCATVSAWDEHTRTYRCRVRGPGGLTASERAAVPRGEKTVLAAGRGVYSRVRRASIAGMQMVRAGASKESRKAVAKAELVERRESAGQLLRAEQFEDDDENSMLFPKACLRHARAAAQEGDEKGGGGRDRQAAGGWQAVGRARLLWDFLEDLAAAGDFNWARSRRTDAPVVVALAEANGKPLGQRLVLVPPKPRAATEKGKRQGLGKKGGSPQRPTGKDRQADGAAGGADGGAAAAAAATGALGASLGDTQSTRILLTELEELQGEELQDVLTDSGSGSGSDSDPSYQAARPGGRARLAAGAAAAADLHGECQQLVREAIGPRAEGLAPPLDADALEAARDASDSMLPFWKVMRCRTATALQPHCNRTLHAALVGGRRRWGRGSGSTAPHSQRRLRPF
jgi:hypothetical protein